MTLALGEVGLRLAGFSYPVFFQPDARLGHAHRPGAEGWWRREGEAFVRISSEGLRDREHPLERDGESLRVALLGDSYAEAMQVAEEDGIQAVLERELASCAAAAGRPVEVIDLGVAGYSTAQQRIQLEEQVWRWSPDAVLLLFTTGNDVQDNLRALANDPDMRPFFVLDGGELRLDASFRESRAYRLRMQPAVDLLYRAMPHSRLLQAAQRLRHARAAARRTAGGARPPEGDADRAPTGEPAARPDGIYTEPTSAPWREAWDTTEALLVAMDAETRARGVPMWLAIGSNPEQVSPDPEARADTAARLGVPDLFYPERRLAALGDRTGFPVVPLAPALAEHATRGGEWLHGFEGSLGHGHWNERGHAVAGRLLAERLCPLLSVPAQR